MEKEIELALIELSKISTLLVKYDRLLEEEKNTLQLERELEEKIKQHNYTRNKQIIEENKKELAKTMLQIITEGDKENAKTKKKLSK